VVIVLFEIAVLEFLEILCFFSSFLQSIAVSFLVEL
jgi:hypothetical protein